MGSAAIPARSVASTCGPIPIERHADRAIERERFDRVDLSPSGRLLVAAAPDGLAGRLRTAWTSS